MVYLIHFQEPVGDRENPHGQARHYLGYSWDPEARCKLHAQGRGARLLQAVEEQGIPWEIARLWEGGRKLERKLKARKDAPKLCPLCSGEAALRRGLYTTRQVLEYRPRA